MRRLELFLLLTVALSGSVPGESDLPRSSPSVRVVRPAPSDTPAGETWIEAAVDGHAPGDRLNVFADGRKVGTLEQPPWRLSWSAGLTLHSHHVTVALVRGGREVATAHVRTRSLGFVSSAQADVVSVSPIVTDRSGRAVLGLTAKDFRVFDDGAPRRIETFDSGESPLAAVLVLDVSNSMMLKVDEARRAAHAFVDAVKPGDDIALLTFNSSVVGWVDFTRERVPLHAAIDATSTEGDTALYDATALALRRLKPLKRRKAVVLFTDGEDNRSRLSVDQVIEMARASESSIYSVAQGDESKRLKGFLDRLADQTGGRSYFIASMRKLSDVFARILGELKSQYFLTFTPPAGRRPRTWHTIQVRVQRPDVVVRARKQYFLD